MNEICLATASCSPIGRPHCTRSRDQSLAIFSASLPVAAQLAGSASLPVFSVVKAIFRPWPSSPMRLAAGIRTWWNLVTPFSRPRRPMNAFRRSTVIPAAAASTMNAVIPPRCPSPFGTRAITTSRSATTPFAQLPGTPDGNLAGADVHALYLAGESVAVTAGDHREVAKEPAVRIDHPDADRVLVGCGLVGGQAAGDVVRHRVRDAVDVKR